MSPVLRVLAVTLLLCFGGCVATPPAAPGSGELLNGLVEGYFDELMALNPMAATLYGDHRFDDRLEIAPSPGYRAAMSALNRRYLDAVAVDRRGNTW